MAPNTKRHNEMLATLTPDVRQQCEAYQRAQGEERAARQVLREAVAAKNAAQSHSYLLAEELEKPALDAPVGSIVYNLRNGRLYEVAKTQPGYAYGAYRHLNPETGYAYRYANYAWGPKLLLPASHPFVQKRLNARLAERLKGEGG